MKHLIFLLVTMVSMLAWADDSLARRLGPGGPYDPRGRHDPRGAYDPRGPHDPRGGNDNEFREEVVDERQDLGEDLRDADDRGDVGEARIDYRKDVRDDFWD